MRAVALQSAGNAEIVTLGPAIQNEQILAVQACGICHSDRKAFYAPPGNMRMPRILGHEVAGTLTFDVPGLGLRTGDQVVLWPAASCGICRFCRSGRENLCGTINLFGYHFDGGFAEGINCAPELISRLRLIKIPPGLNMEQATFCEPIACIVNAFRKVQNRPTTCLVVGAGTMGRLTGRVAKDLWQTTVLYHDINPVRLAEASIDGEYCPENQRADLVFVAASDHATLDFGLAHLAPGGTMVLFSGMEKGTLLQLQANELHRSEQCLVGAYGCTPDDMHQAIGLLAEQRVEVEDLISQRLGMEQLPEELGRLPRPEEFKTVVII